MLKDNKVPGSLGIGSAAGFLGEGQAGLCEQPGDCLDQGGVNRKNFSKRERKQRHSAAN